MGTVESFTIKMSTCGEAISTKDLLSQEVSTMDVSNTSSGAKRKLIMDSTSPNKKVHCLEENLSNQEMWENFLDQLKNVCHRNGGLFLERMLTEYLGSSSVVVLNLDDVELLENLLLYVKDLPDYLRVEVFTGREQIVCCLQEELWSELKQAAENEKLFDLWSSSTDLGHFLQFVKSYQRGKNPSRALTSGLPPSIGKMNRTRRDTSTSYTTAIPTEDNADAVSSKAVDLYTTLRELSTPTTSQQKTSSVSSYISARKNGNLRTFSLTTEEQPYLLKLRCYKLSDIQGVPERDQWKKSYADMTLHFGHLSDAHGLLGNLFQGATKEILDAGGSVWERKA